MKTLSLILRAVFLILYLFFLAAAIAFQYKGNYPAATYNLIFGIFMFWLCIRQEE